MPKYTRDDHLQVVDGKTVIFADRTQAGFAGSDEPGSRAGSEGADYAAPQPAGAAARAATEREELAGMQAAALTSAAQKGTPFCAECEQAKRDLAHKGPA
jgi:hypothetical protein